MIRERNVIPGELPETTQVAEGEASTQDHTGPARPTVQPLPTVQPRARRAGTSEATEDEYYLDPNDGTIKPEPLPEVPETWTPPVTYQAPARDWD